MGKWVFIPFIKILKNSFSFTYQQLPTQHKSYIWLVSSVFSLRHSEGILAHSQRRGRMKLAVWPPGMRVRSPSPQMANSLLLTSVVSHSWFYLISILLNEKELRYSSWLFNLHRVTLPRKKPLVDWRRAISKNCYEPESTWEPGTQSTPSTRWAWGVEVVARNPARKDGSCRGLYCRTPLVTQGFFQLVVITS